MSKRDVLAILSSGEGPAARILAQLRKAVRPQGYRFGLAQADEVPPFLKLSDYGGLVMCADLQDEPQRRALVGFLESYRRELDQLPTIFFSPAPLSSHHHGSHEAALRNVQLLEKETGWRPDCVARIGEGDQANCGVIKRRFLQHGGGGRREVSEEYLLASWSTLQRFAEELVGMFERAAEKTPVQVHAPL